LGALMMFMFTGLSPVKFEKKARQEVLESMYFFSGNYDLSVLITSCLSDDLEKRPSLDAVRNAIDTFRQELSHDSQPGVGNVIHSKINKNGWRTLINEALTGLITFGQINKDSQWESLKKQEDVVHGYQPVERSVQIGWQTGMSGILYLLSRAQKMGYDVQRCNRAFSAGLEFICEQISHPEINIS